MECPLSSVPHPLSLDSSLSPCSLLDLSVAAEPHPTQPISVQRRTGCLRGDSSVTEASNQLQGPTTTANQPTECPEGVELNTALALRAKLQSAQEAQWDADKAVKETLGKNGQTQTVINRRATQGVSFPPRARLYSALVSVCVPEGHVIKEAVQRLPLAAAHKAMPHPATGPSLLPLTFDLYHRPLALLPSPTPSLKSCPHSAPFNLFQKQQLWNTSP